MTEKMLLISCAGAAGCSEARGCFPMQSDFVDEQDEFYLQHGRDPEARLYVGRRLFNEPDLVMNMVASWVDRVHRFQTYQSVRSGGGT